MGIPLVEPVFETMRCTPRIEKFRRRRLEIFKRTRMLFVASLTMVASLISRREERHFARHALDLKNMPEDEFRFFFRLESYNDFMRIHNSLGLSGPIVCDNGTSVSSEFGLAVLLRRLAYPNRWGDLMALLGREKTQLSRIYNKVVDEIYEKKGYLLESLDWVPHEQAAKYAHAVHGASELYENCIGFLDGTARMICRPGSKQQDFYSGHKAHHAYKYQSLLSPDGLILNLYGPIEGRRHDSYMLGQSKLIPRLRRKNEEWGSQYCVYADKGYSVNDEVQTPFLGNFLSEYQCAFNKRMSICRTAVEYGFLKITQYFAFGNYWQNQKIFWQQCCKSYVVSALLANCHTCLYGFELINSRYKLRPPSLEVYLDSRLL